MSAGTTETDAIGWTPYGYLIAVRKTSEIFSTTYQCPDCNTRFTALDTLTEHIATDHLEYEPYGCLFESCTIRRYTREKLALHIRAKSHGKDTSFRYDEDEEKRKRLHQFTADVNSKYLGGLFVSADSRTAISTNDGVGDTQNTIQDTSFQFSSAANRSCFESGNSSTPIMNERRNEGISCTPVQYSLPLENQDRFTTRLADKETTEDTHFSTNQNPMLTYQEASFQTDITTNETLEFDTPDSEEVTSDNEMQDQNLTKNAEISSIQPEKQNRNIKEETDLNTGEKIGTTNVRSLLYRMIYSEGQDTVADLEKLPALTSKRKRASRASGSTNKRKSTYRKDQDEYVYCKICQSVTLHRATRGHSWTHFKRKLLRCELCLYSRKTTDASGGRNKMVEHIRVEHPEVEPPADANAHSIYYTDEKPNYYMEILEIMQRCYGDTLPTNTTTAKMVFGPQNVKRVPRHWDRLRYERLHPKDTFFTPVQNRLRGQKPTPTSSSQCDADDNGSAD